MQIAEHLFNQAVGKRDSMILVVNSGGEAAHPSWADGFREALPDLDVRWWNDPAVAAEDVVYALVYAPDAGRLATYPNLRLILSAGVGVDHIVCDASLPSHLPIVRMGGDETAQRMGEYVCLGALALLRGLKRAVNQQAAQKWQTFGQERSATDTRVGVLGLGNLGTKSAAMLQGLGFQTAGWARSRKSIPGVESFVGDEEFDAFLKRTDILVNLLPDTPETRGLLDLRTLSMLPAGAAVLNAGRGSHIVVPDLLACLDSGHLSGAFLDVFDPEPLSPDSPVWDHPKIIVTPHIGSMASIRRRAQFAANAIAAFQRGDALPNRYDPARGY